MPNKIMPHITTTVAILVIAYWLLQTVASDPLLAWIIKIAALLTILIILAHVIWFINRFARNVHRAQELNNRGLELVNLKKEVEIRLMLPGSRPLLGLPSPHENSNQIVDSIPSRKSGLGTVFLIGLVIILIIMLVVGGILLYQHQRGSLGSTDAAATASAVAVNPYPSYFSGHRSLVVYDPLNRSAGSVWETSPGTCQFVEQEAYDVITTDIHSCADPKTRFRNFTYEAEMTVLTGHCGGLLFGRQSTYGSNYYLFQVCENRTYALLKYLTDATGIHVQSLPTPSPTNSAISQGVRNTNRIAVLTNGNTTDLYIADHQVAEVQNMSDTEGYIALVASSDGTNDATKVAYRNVRVWVDES